LCIIDFRQKKVGKGVREREREWKVKKGNIKMIKSNWYLSMSWYLILLDNDLLDRMLEERVDEDDRFDEFQLNHWI